MLSKNLKLSNELCLFPIVSIYIDSTCSKVGWLTGVGNTYVSTSLFTSFLTVVIIAAEKIRDFDFSDIYSILIFPL